MSFERIQAIWDSQVSGPPPQVSHEELVRTVRRRSRALRFGVNFEEAIFVFVCLFFPAINGFFSGEHLYESVGGAIFVGVAIFTVAGRIRRVRAERRFEPTVLGELDRAIHRLDWQIWRARNFAWWFLLPTVIYSCISMTQHFTWSGALAAAIGYPFTYGAIELARRRSFLPQRRSLEALREELVRTPE